MEYIEDQGMSVTGDIVETYAIDYIDTRKSDEYVTIIEIPVERTSKVHA